MGLIGLFIKILQICLITCQLLRSILKLTTAVILLLVSGGCDFPKTAKRDVFNATLVLVLFMIFFLDGFDFLVLSLSTCLPICVI